ncbi:transcriptional regulator [Cypionkella aquatica]|uniref:diguanylate cyclase n=1 Tax=Cypionkella aquatica TaxID=1756042 RepID=A0AA37U292_9RHOB|nr:diguanylate cyclase [Cypionkella aquatica]GLS86094.1 transcriptional regulator [Cypionkella aquatica]
MRLYAAMSRIFPASFLAKVFLVTFLGIHVPLLALGFWAIKSNGGPLAHIGPLLVALVATLVGTVLTLWALHAILRPVFLTEAALRNYEATGKTMPLPQGYGDQVGRLMEATNRLILSVEWQIDDSRRKSETDSLTGLLNRRGFERRMPKQLRGALLIGDVDAFKSINDRHGHAEGDRVLAKIAELFSKSVRAGDLVSRFGGDEFLIYLPDVDSAQATTTAQRLRQAVQNHIWGDDLAVSVTIGVAVAPNGADLNTLFKQADALLYESKSRVDHASHDGAVNMGGLRH